jgi:hypothetical protein
MKRGLVKLNKLNELGMYNCTNVIPESPGNLFDREEVAAYQEEIKKSMK